jgi:hypothetical protein
MCFFCPLIYPCTSIYQIQKMKKTSTIIYKYEIHLQLQKFHFFHKKLIESIQNFRLKNSTQLSCITELIQTLEMTTKNLRYLETMEGQAIGILHFYISNFDG